VLGRYILQSLKKRSQLTINHRSIGEKHESKMNCGLRCILVGTVLASA